jgi:Ammonium Transporter Family
LKGQFTSLRPIGFQLLSCNISGAILIAAWAVLWILPLFALLRKMNVLRVPLEMELGGLDIAKHNEEAYSTEAWQSFLMTYKQNRTPVECLNPLSQEAIPAPPPLPAPLIELQPVVQGFMQSRFKFFTISEFTSSSQC